MAGVTNYWDNIPRRRKSLCIGFKFWKLQCNIKQKQSRLVDRERAEDSRNKEYENSVEHT